MDAILQVVAWSRMLVEYSTEAGISEGVSMTFDGQHPCSMCTAIAASRAQQTEKKKEPSELPSLKLAAIEFVPPGISKTPFPQAVDWVVAGFAPCGSGHSLDAGKPPVPPPRVSRV